MAFKPPADYTDKDFDAILARLQTEIIARLPAWTDFTSTSFGNMLLQSFAIVGDMLAYYLDRYANEAHLPTVITRRSLISLGKLIGFEIAGASAAIVTIRFSIPAAAADDVQVAILTPVLTPEGIIFETQAATTLVQGNTFVDITAENSEFHSTGFIGTGDADQEYILDRTPYLDGSAVVTADAVAHTEVANFLLSTPTSKHYVVLVDENDQASIRFGDGTNGAVPPAASNIQVNYNTGGGLVGNVIAAQLTVLNGTFKDDSGNVVALSTTNALKAVGGLDRESFQSAKERAPLTLRQIGDRTVAKDDYVAHSEEVPGVARAQALGRQDDPGLLANAAEVTIIPTGGGLPSAALKAAVLKNLTETKPNTIGVNVTVVDPTFKTIAITADITLETDAVQAEVDTAIKAALAAFFAPRNADGTKNLKVDFGAGRPTVQFSDLFLTVGNVAGVDAVAKATFIPAADTAIALREFPEVGTITLNFI